MKKKFVKGLLMAAIAVAPMSFLTSCTDHEEDRIAELQVLLGKENATLKEQIEAQIKTLEQRIIALESVGDCAHKCDSVITARLSEYLTIAQAQTTYLTITGAQQYYVTNGSVYTKEEIDRLLENLQGQGSFNRDEIVNIINEVIQQNIVNNYITVNQAETIKQEIINEILKDVYSKSELTTILNNYYTQQQIDQMLTQNYYTKSEVTNIINQLITNALGDYYNKTQIDQLLQQIINQGQDTYTKEEINNLLAGKVDATTLDQLLSNYVTKEELEEALSDKISRSDLEQILTHYYTKDDLATLLSQYLTEEEVRNIIKIELRSYYTAQQVLALLQQYLGQQGITREEVERMLQDYYPKSELFTKEEVRTMFLNYYDKDYIDALILDYAKKTEVVNLVLTQLNTAESELQNAVINLINVQIATSTFNYGNDKLTIQQVVDKLHEVAEQASKAAADIVTINSNITTIQGDITNIQGDITNIQGDITNINGNIFNIQDSLKNLYDSIAKYANTITGLTDELGTVKQTANDAKSQADANTALINGLQTRVDSIVDVLKNMQPGGTNCDCDFTELISRLDSLSDVTAAMADKAKADSATAAQNLKDVEDLLTQAQDNFKQALADSIKDVKDLLNTTVAGLRETYDGAVEELQGQIDDLTERVEANEEAIEELTNQLNELLQSAATTDWVQKELAKQVTSVIIQGAYSPVFGGGALPVGVELNMLAAFHGELGGNDVTFPSPDATYLANPNEGDDETGEAYDFTLNDYELLLPQDTTISAYSKLVNPNADNAGKLYLTINPSTVDFSNLNVSLENSQGQTVAITTGPLRKSNEVLTYGYTRANDGFYEVDARLDPDLNSGAQSVKANVSLSELKDLASDLRHFRTNGFDVSKIISTLYNSVEDALPRYGVAVTYSDANGTHKVVSKYDVAAMSVKPISFYNVALASYSRDHVPYIWRAERFLLNVIDRAEAAVLRAYRTAYSKIDLDGIRNIKLETLYEGDGDLYARLSHITDTVYVDASKFADAVQVVDEYGQVATVQIVPVDGDASKVEVIVTIDIQYEINKLYEDIQEPIADAINAVQDLFDQIDDFDVYLERQNFAGRFKEQVTKYITKINNRFTRYFDDLNNYLQITMFVGKNDIYSRLSPSMRRPTKANGTVKLIPYSFNAETISPVFLKYVAVTNVWPVAGGQSAQDGNSACLAALQRANAQNDLNQVINGGKTVIEFTPERGYKYEIVYGALDYMGKAQYRKYYVQY